MVLRTGIPPPTAASNSRLTLFFSAIIDNLSPYLAIKALKLNYFPNNYIKKDSSIETKVLGKKIFNPIGIAAGFDKDAQVYNSLFKLGFGFVEVGTVTPLKQY